MVCVYLYSSYPLIIPLYLLSVLDMNTIASWELEYDARFIS
jgi:hypothetical protein